MQSETAEDLPDNARTRLDDLIRRVSGLQRTRMTPDGFLNTWHINIRPRPFPDNNGQKIKGDWLLIINPYSALYFINCIKEAELIYDRDPTICAQRALPHILESILRVDRRFHTGAPWNWTVPDQGLAGALGALMMAKNVRADLWHVGVAPEELRRYEYSVWETWVYKDVVGYTFPNHFTNFDKDGNRIAGESSGSRVSGNGVLTWKYTDVNLVNGESQ